VGNVVGSNIFNLLGVLGAAGVVGGGIVISRTTLLFDVPIMMLVALVCLPIFFTGTRISRGEGMFFLAGYAAYLLFLISRARCEATGTEVGTPILHLLSPALLFSLGYRSR